MRAWVAKPAFPVDNVTIVSTVILFHVSMMICFRVDMETRRQRRKEAPMIISAAIPKGGTGKSTLLRTPRIRRAALRLLPDGCGAAAVQVSGDQQRA
ncbi:hypothetical protein [Mesorhizobium sp. LNHC209A00]|uniref:hypothetical protein n=1 Tax=Mesorhizobium TaxID=68287 RepID=UPI0012EB1969|nr:hypothetical protein [Mesorhizobium sp. LNHC209A00]